MTEASSHVILKMDILSFALEVSTMYRSETDILNLLKLNISTARHCILDVSWKNDTHSVSFSWLYCIRSGEGWLRYGDKSVTLQGGYAYLIPAHLEVSYGCTELEKIYFHISLLGFEKTDLLATLKDVCVLPFPETDYCDLFRLMNTADYLDLLKIKEILLRTAISFLAHYRTAPMPVRDYSENVKKTMRYIQSNPLISLTSSQIAKALFLSETKMRLDFKKETGKTIGEYKNDLIFSQIRSLLATGSLSVGELSRRYGFCDPYHLSRRFKERFHQSPTEYRKASSVHK